MKNRCLPAIAPLLALTFFCAAEARSEQVTLTEALHSAMADRALVRAHAADTEAARENQAAAASRYLPRLSLSEQLYWTDEPGGSLFISLNQKDLELSQSADTYNDAPSRKDFETRLTLSQTLYDADIGIGRKRAAVQVDAATADERQGRESAAITVLDAYLDVQMNRTRVAAAEAALSEAEEVLAIAGQRQEAGLGLKAETLRAGNLVSEAQLGLLTARHDLRLGRHQLAFAMGRPGGEIDVAAPLTPEVLPEPVYGEPLQRGDLRALELHAEDARLVVRQEQASLLPKAELQASYIMHDEDLPLGGDADAWSLMAGIRWEFFDGFERTHRKAGAEARRRAVQERHLDRTRQVRLALEKARLQNEQAKVALELAVNGREAAREARAVIVERYRAGLAPLSDLLAVQAELERSRHALVVAETDLVRARAMAHFQKGTLLNALSLSEGENSR